MVRVRRLELYNMFLAIKDHGQSKMLRGLFTVLAGDSDVEDVIYTLRNFSRIGCSHPRIIGLTHMAGPRCCGKSWIMYLLLRFLGEERHNYAKVLAGSVLCKEERDSANASRPVINQLRGKKLVSFREVPKKPLIPSTMKELMDHTDGRLEARHNNSREHEDTSFRINFVMMATGNSTPTIATHGDEEHGMDGKIYQLRTDFKLVPNPVADNERQADPDLVTATEHHELNGEAPRNSCSERGCGRL